jgi:hypothetical protein
VGTLFVGVHAALAIVIALFGLSFLLDPCGGGGDLCLGGVIGTTALAAAAIGAVGIVVWSAAHRASPLLVFDATLGSVGGYFLLESFGGGPALLELSIVAVTTLGLVGAALSGRAVVAHRLERLLAMAALATTVVLFGVGGIAILAVGMLALGAGALVARTSRAAADSTGDRHAA